MRKSIMLFLTFLVVLFIGNTAFAHEATYSVKQIGENTITVTLKADAKSGKGVEITSASKRGGKELNIFYRTDGAKTSDSMDVDLRTMLPPIRIILTNISDADKALFPDTKGIDQEEYIQHLHDMGAIEGFPDGTFKPGSGVTRAEFVTMMLKSLNINKKPTSKGFKDTIKHWAKDAINTAYDMKIINGFKDGTFKPNDGITAAQASKIIDSLFKFRTNTNTALPKLNEKHWANAAIKKIMAAGVIMPDDKLFKEFREESPLSRADCAMILSRAITTQ
jgi:hypothetical protein